MKNYGHITTKDSDGKSVEIAITGYIKAGNAKRSNRR